MFDTPLDASTNKDTLTDFTPGTDTIVLVDSIFQTFDAAHGALVPESAFRSGEGLSQAQDTDDRILYDTATGTLYYDADGTGEAAAIAFAVPGVTAHPLLRAADLFISD